MIDTVGILVTSLTVIQANRGVRLFSSRSTIVVIRVPCEISLMLQTLRTSSVRLLTVDYYPYHSLRGMDRKPVLRAHRCSVPEWMIVAIRIASI